jgi:hypothetical protein
MPSCVASLPKTGRHCMRIGDSSLARSEAPLSRLPATARTSPADARLLCEGCYLYASYSLPNTAAAILSLRISSVPS